MHKLNLKAGLILVCTLMVVQAACDLGYVDKADYEKQSKELQESKKQVELLQKQLAAKSEHHYSLERVGFRTFRFDSNTGESCVELTSEADWKKPQTQSASCNCVDLYHDGAVPDKSIREIQCGF